MKQLQTAVLALLFAALGGCSSLEPKSFGGKELVKNADGHVIGYKERADDVDRVVLFTPRFSERGNIVAYEERMKGGVVLWDLNGKRVGARYVDLRSRGTNAYNSGLTIVFRPRESEHLAQQQYVAQVTIENIKQYLGIPN